MEKDPKPDFNLTPAKRALLEALLEKKDRGLPKRQTITRRQKSGPSRLSYAQRSMWFFYKMEGGEDLYNVPVTYRLQGKLDIPALEYSLNCIIQRHEILRTTFIERDGEAQQVVAPELQIKIGVVDLRTIPEERREAEAKRILVGMGSEAFDLFRGPLVRANLIQLGRQDYFLLVNFHHIIIDEWSINLLFNELNKIYTARLANATAELPELPIQYADFADWQAEWLQSGVIDKQLDYWKQKLAGAPPILEIKPDFPRPAVPEYRGASKERLYSGELLDDLRELGKSERATLFTTLLTAFQVLLARYSGQPDILVGTPIANRRHFELKNIIGFFLNTVVLRCDLRGSPTFRQLLQQTKANVLEAFENQDLPFEKLVEELNPQRDNNRNPLFQVSFVLHPSNTREVQLSGLQISRQMLDYGVAKFDLTLYITERSDGLNAFLEYNTALFDGQTIERWLGNYGVLLEAIAANPDLPVDRLPILSEEELDQILFKWNSTWAAFPSRKCVQQLFEEQALRTPQTVAVCSAAADEAARLTYQELDSRANRLARYLQKMGVGPDVLVGICLESSPELVVAMLGTLKAGGAYVPIDPNYPAERIAYMLEDARAPLLLTRQGLLDKTGIIQAQKVCLDADWPVIAREPGDRPACQATADNLAYVIYTSGSTGEPKGVMIPHRALCNHMSWMQAAYPLTAADKVLQKTLITFDASVWEFYAPLLAGAQLVTIKPGGQRDIPYLLETIQHMGITILQVVPSILRLLVADPRFQQCTSLRRLFSGGEALTPDLAARVMQTLELELVNLYGPAEACIDTITLRLPPQDRYEVVPVGRPVANTQVYILDQNLEPLPVGVPGEIYIGGDSLGRGYWNRPDLTAESFIPNPFTFVDEPYATAGKRIYRTGDRGCFLSDGTIEYLGRLDDQVKLAGARIELDEVEAALLAQPGIRQAVVVLSQPEAQSGEEPGATAEKRLAAYVVPEPGMDLNLTALRIALKSRLPEYMLPTIIMPLQALPLLPNGKLDRKALPVLAFDRQTMGERYTPPRDALEEQLCQTWEAVLNIHPVGREDNFFDLGGHSLLAIRLAGEIEKRFGQRIPIALIFQTPTVAGLAEILRQEESLAPLQVIPRRASAGPAPLSFGQERIWFLDRLGVGAQAYNVPSAFRIRGALDTAALEGSVNKVIQRHAILRTTFSEMNGELRQVVGEELILPVRVEDLSEIPPAGLEQAVRNRLYALGNEAFDLAAGPLIRLHMLRIAETDHCLLLNMHHIISDEWSAEIFNRELATFYQAEIRGTPASLPDLRLEYADYAAWQIDWLTSENEAEQLDYWKKKLSGAPQSLDLPIDRPRPTAPSYRGGRMRRKISGELVNALQQLSRAEQVTLFVTLLAAFQVLLYRYTGHEDLLVGSPIANRRQPELEDLIGFFLNTLVFRSELKGNPACREVIRRLSGAVLEAFEHQELPFERLVEALKPARDLSRHPLFQTMFVFLPARLQGLQIPGLEIEPLNIDYGWSKFDLTLFASELPDGLELSMEYSSDLFDGASIERMLEHYELLLSGMAANPQQPVASLPMLTDAESLEMSSWNNTRSDFPEKLSVHQLFELQVERTPQAQAVEQPGKASLSYAELNSRANQLAQYLVEMGVVPDIPVGIFLERSSDLIVAVLGILKAGGACLPLDPSYPKKRLEAMCADARLGLVLSQGGLIAELPETSARVVCLDEAVSDHEQNCADIENRAGPENLAYVLYTSGSTGQPKGVMMRHRPLVNLLFWQMGSYSGRREARTLQLTSLSFDVSFQEIMATLSSGGCLVLVSEAVRKDLPRLLEYLREQSIERLFLPFVALQALAETADSLGSYPESLREVITAGEQLQATPEIRRLFERLPGCRLHNQYGPTETHVVSAYSLPEKPQDWPSLPPVGKPIANTRIRLLDANGMPAPIGVTGEIFLGGDCLARGYLRRPDLTAERFLPDPFGLDGERLYRTGDLGRYLPDGNIQFLGRIDQQVKIRGFRVEPAEVELTLAAHPIVYQVAVLALPAQGGARQLMAYLVPQAGQTLQVDDLRSFLRSRLPEYMLPSAFLTLDEMPVTPSGKVDRLRLAAREDLSTGRLQAGPGYVAPRDDVENQLCQIWETVLEVPRVGLDDDFFELGGHSLLAIRLFTRIEARLGRRLPLSTLFEAPTVRRLAEYLRGAGPVADWSPVVVIQQGGSLPPFFCVHNFGGEIINLNALSQELGPDQPFIGLQAQGLDGRAEPHSTIPEMAACYVQAMRAYQPTGPYYMGGFCFGGVVAYEMACQLQAQGERVGLVALFDAYAPARVHPGEAVGGLQRTVSFFKNLPFWWRDFLVIDAGERRVVVKRRLTRIKKALLRLFGRQAEMTPRELIGEHAHVEEAPAHVKRLMELHMLALLNYAPAEYAGRVTLYRIQRMPLFSYVAPDAGWGGLARGGVEIVMIPGSHQNILRPPYVQELARKLSDSLQRARSKL